MGKKAKRKSETKKTNAARALDRANVPYTLHPYDVDESDLSAQTVAAKVGLPVEQVFKTLLCRGDAGLCMGVVAAHQELNLKAFAKARGEKKLTMVPMAKLFDLTGMIRGGVTAVGGKRAFPTVIDESALGFDVISVSAGVRGLQIFVAPDAFVTVTAATVAPIGRTG